MDRVTEVEAFVKTVELGSQAAAAVAMGVSRMTIGRLIRDLENRMGVQLLERTTRRQALTAAGNAYVDSAKKLVSQYHAFISQEREPVWSKLRVSAPVSFGVRVLIPIVTRFVANNPDADIDLDLSDRMIDLARDGFDVAIRIRNEIDNKLESRNLGRTRTIICGSPEYLAQAAPLLTPADLVHHSCLRYSYSDQGGFWNLRSHDGSIHRAPVSGMLTCNNGDALLEAAVYWNGTDCTARFHRRTCAGGRQACPGAEGLHLPQPCDPGFLPSARAVARQYPAFPRLHRCRMQPSWQSSNLNGVASGADPYR